jgi:hypothetical protein
MRTSHQLLTADLLQLLHYATELAEIERFCDINPSLRSHRW